MCAELHFEQAVLKHALSKHVHHFDCRDGMRSRARPGRPCRVKAPRSAREVYGRPLAEVAQDIYADLAPPAPPASRPPRRFWPALLDLRRPSIPAPRLCPRWARNYQHFMEKQILLDSDISDNANAENMEKGPKSDTSSEDDDEKSPRLGERHERSQSPQSPQSPRPIRTFKGRDPQEEAWKRWQFLQHMPNYLAWMVEQKEYRELVSKGHQSQLSSARRQVMASDLAVLLRVLPMFSDGDNDGGDDRDVAEELALVLSSTGRRSRPTRAQPPTVQRRASKLSSLPTATTAMESLATRRASVENMADSIVEAIRVASGKAKAARPPSKGRSIPSSKRRQSQSQERSRTAGHLQSQSGQSGLQSRRNSSALGSEADEHQDSPASLETVSLESLLDALPSATKVRWGDILKVTDADLHSSKHRFIMRIAHALRQKPQWFIVHESIGSGEMSAELVEPQPLDSPLPPSAEDVPQRCHCWLGSLMVLHRLEEVAEVLSESWQFQVSLERLERVAASVERAESLVLCGGFALTLDVCPGDTMTTITCLRIAQICTRGWM